MFDRFGVAGLVGILLLFGGIALAAWQNPIIAGALVLIVLGLGLIIYGLVTNLIQSLGMGQMM
jgi:hypothetical protein